MLFVILLIVYAKLVVIAQSYTTFLLVHLKIRWTYEKISFSEEVFSNKEVSSILKGIFYLSNHFINILT